MTPKITVTLDRHHADTYLRGVHEELPGMVEAVAHVDEAIAQALAARQGGGRS